MLRRSPAAWRLWLSLALLPLHGAIALAQGEAPPQRSSGPEVLSVGIMAGDIDGTSARIAADMAAVLDGPQLRVVPMLGKGAAQNAADILRLRGVDLGIVQSDVLAYLRQDRRLPGIERQLEYVTKLYNEELHVLARGAGDLKALVGRRVNIGEKGSGSAITATVVFGRLGIAIEPTQYDPALALEKLKTGEIAALLDVSGQPAPLLRELRAEEGWQLLPVPANEALLETYFPASLTAEAYPGLIRPGRTVETVAIGAVLAAYSWPADSERYRHVARFVDLMFGRFGAFLVPPRHAKWREVNLSAELPGWRRFPEADRWLRRARSGVAPAAALGRESPMLSSVVR